MVPPVKGTILVVDDEFAIADTIRDLLTEEGYQVTTAGNGREGLLRLEEGRPSLVVTDVMMPVMGGLELLQAMRDSPNYQDIPVIIMSSAPRSAGIRATLEAEAKVAFLRKPFDISGLLALIEQMLKASPPQ